MKSKKKLQAMFLAAAMSVAMVPVIPTAVHAEESGTAKDTIQKLITPEKPDWYKEQDDSNPYGYKKGVPFRLYEDAELYTFTSDPNWDPKAYIYELYQKGDGSHFLDDDSWKTVEAVDLSAADYNDGSIKDHWFVTAIPLDLGYNLDADGQASPRKTCIAFLGAKKNGDVMDVDVWVYDTKCGKYSNVLTVGQMSDIKANTGDDNETLLYQVRNFMTFTAGDYDDDQKDSIVAFGAFSDGPDLVEVMVEGDGSEAPVLTKGADSSALLHPKYMEQISAFSSDHSADGRYKLGCSLVTGDVNGDKVDDLVAVSYTQILNDNKASTYGDEIIMPALAVSPGGSGKTGSGLLGDTTYEIEYIGGETKDAEDFPNCTERLSMAYPTAMVARTDLVAGNQIVVGGYYENILRLKSDGSVADVERDGDGASLFVYDYSKDKPECILADGDSYTFATALKKGEIPGEEETTLSKIPFAAVSIDGAAAPDRIFIGGTFWEISNETSKIKKVYTIPCLDCTYEVGDFVKDAGSEKVVDIYFDNMSVQSLSKVGGDYESLAFSMVAVIHGDVTLLDSPYTYCFRAGVAGPSIDAETSRMTGKFGTKSDQLYQFTVPGNPDVILLNDIQFDLQNSDRPKSNFVLCPVDTVDDGLTVRFNSKDITFADPQILAVLQASPYFGVLDQEGATTTYKFESEFSRSDETSHTCSVGIGFSAEATTPVIDASFKLGYTGETKTWSETEYSTDISVGFDAVHDSVIVYRTPVVFYSYDVWKPDTGKWEENGLGISYANTPEYQQLSVDDYNSFVEQYNAEGERRAKEKGSTTEFPALSPLGEGLYLGCEGDPTKYYQGGDQPAGYTVIDEHEHALSYNGGEDFTEFETGESVTKGSEREDGVSFDFEVTFGAEFAKAGPYFSLEDMKGHTVTTVKTDKTGITAAVANLDEEKLKAAYTEDQIHAFGFNWVPASWDSGIKYEYKDKDGNVHLSKTVPVYGYGLSSLTCPLNLADAKLTIDPGDFNYDGTAKTPSVKVELDGKELDPADYTISYLFGGSAVEQCIEPGTYTVVAAGAGPNIGKTESTFTITKRTDISDGELTLTEDTFDFDMSEKKPEITVKLSGQTLKQKEDYTVEYQQDGKAVTECIDPGIYTVAVTGAGDYMGSLSSQFTIRDTRTDITNAEVTVDPLEFTFDGYPKTPLITVAVGGKTLTAGTDYDVKYQYLGAHVYDCINEGTYTAEITGKGMYKGTTSGQFEIVSKKLTDIQDATLTIEPEECFYDGTVRMPKVTLTLEGNVLKQGTDYKLYYLLSGVPVESCKEPGVYTVVAEGDGDYTGSVSGTYEIKKKPDPISIKDAKVVLSAAEYSYNAKAQKPGIKTIAGKTLKEGKDYTAVWPASSVDAGEYTIIIVGQGEYTGTTKAGYRIKAKAIKPSVTLQPASAAYTGKLQTPTVTVKDGTKILKKGSDYRVTYSSGRKKPGKYTVTVTMMRNYSGKAVKNFTITKAANPLAVKAKKAKLSQEKLQKKKQTLAITDVVSFTKKGKGTMTYKLVSVAKSSAKKYFSISTKTGKITVKKGLKKGTYRLKIKMTAAGNEYYKASAAKTVIVQITVK